MRHVIVHYHLFKNAGSSIDDLLRRNHGERWLTLEGPHPWSTVSADSLAAFLTEHPDALSVSSHQARLPLPRLPDTVCHPILFLRHPLDRLGSVYHYERSQKYGDTSPGMVAARSLGFSGYVRWRLEPGHGCTLTDFHTVMLAGTHVDMRVAQAHQQDFIAAQQTLAALPFFGLVERFEESLRLLAHSLDGTGLLPDMTHGHHNRTPGRMDALERRLETTREALGETLYAQVLERNRFDLSLYDMAARLFEARLAALPTGGAAAR